MQTSSGLKLSFMNECERIKWKAGKFRLDICFLKICSPKKFFPISKGPCLFGLSLLRQRQSGPECAGLSGGPIVIPALQGWGDDASHCCSAILVSGNYV